MLMEDTYYEAYQDIESRKSECYCEKGWMRQMSGMLASLACKTSCTVGNQKCANEENK